MLTKQEMQSVAAERVAEIAKEFTEGFKFLENYPKSVTFFGSTQSMNAVSPGLVSLIPAFGLPAILSPTINLNPAVELAAKERTERREKHLDRNAMAGHGSPGGGTGHETGTGFQPSLFAIFAFLRGHSNRRF